MTGYTRKELKEIKANIHKYRRAEMKEYWFAGHGAVKTIMDEASKRRLKLMEEEMDCVIPNDYIEQL